jgi:hypothetical protein
MNKKRHGEIHQISERYGNQDYAFCHWIEKVVNSVEKRLKLRAYNGINCYDADGHLPGNKLINNETAY